MIKKRAEESILMEIAHEKMPNIIIRERQIKNYNEVLHHTGQNGHHQNVYK